MKAFFYPLMVISMLLSLSSTTFAGYEQPKQCPSSSSIISEGLDFAYEHGDQQYGVYKKSFYNTNNHWFFGIGLIKAQNDSLAQLKANLLLMGLRGSPSPVCSKSGHWACYYSIEGSSATAVAVLINNIPASQHSMRPYFH